RRVLFRSRIRSSGKPAARSEGAAVDDALRIIMRGAGFQPATTAFEPACLLRASKDMPARKRALPPERLLHAHPNRSNTHDETQESSLGILRRLGHVHYHSLAEGKLPVRSGRGA